MKTHPKVAIFLGLAFAGLGMFISSFSRDAGDISAADWLVGTWVRKTSTRVMYESWQKEADLSLSGKSYTLREVAGGDAGGRGSAAGGIVAATGGSVATVAGSTKVDTVVFETIRLIEEGGKLYYIPTVKNQNSGQPVRFAQKEISSSLLVFENQAHDFPQIISYRKVGADSLVAEISGKINGNDRKQTFAMKKVR